MAATIAPLQSVCFASSRLSRFPVSWSSSFSRSRRFARRVSAMASQDVDLEVFGKAATGTGSPSNQRGDCPFSQRVYMVLEEKHLPYKATYVEEGPNKPDWFMQRNPSGLMPVLRDAADWIQDSDKIFEHVENKFKEPSLKTPDEFKSVGAGIFPAFTNWLKSKDRSAPAKQEFINELTALEEHLKKHGPYIAGKNPTNSDFALAPKLHHARVALKHFIDFVFPSNLQHVAKYIELMETRPSFKKTDSPDEMIIAGWQTKFELPDKIDKNSGKEKKTAFTPLV
ncbi:glutathione S-transferase DHAR2 [Selaginella moellendorffii]|nr:glutathione S-transferase DHAR2 [Selaginella moellendorffii]|eukprot:XP_002967253.2 glutathione S-transferase DHAR2 [Selaginella moellendorffii]